jgi:hypothetical protein
LTSSPARQHRSPAQLTIRNEEALNRIVEWAGTGPEDTVLGDGHNFTKRQQRIEDVKIKNKQTQKFVV